MPSPVLMKPRLMKNAMTISQMAVLEKPAKLSFNPTVPVSTHTVMDMMAMAPIGKGLMIRPTMVAAKMANICQAFASSPAGTGQNHSATPTANVMISIGHLIPVFPPVLRLARAALVRAPNCVTASTCIPFLSVPPPVDPAIDRRAADVKASATVRRIPRCRRIMRRTSGPPRPATPLGGRSLGCMVPVALVNFPHPRRVYFDVCPVGSR